MSDMDTSVRQTLEAFRTVADAVFLRTNSAWIELDLTMAQLKALLVLEREGNATIGRVAEVLGIGMPTSSHLINRLVQANLSERVEDPTDRRRTTVYLTAEGQSLIKDLRHGRREYVRAYLERLDPADLASLRHGLQALNRILRDDQEESSPSYSY